jgi:hypothetical protein
MGELLLKTFAKLWKYRSIEIGLISRFLETYYDSLKT